MKFKWLDYTPEQSDLVNSWLDDDAVRFTGMDEGWDADYNYWKNEPYNTLGKNYWSKVVCDENGPFALIELGMDNGKLNVMEFFISPEKRNKGYGASILQELINNGGAIIGKEIYEAEAVIFPSNIPSQKSFENAGFAYKSTSDDGYALYYNYKKAI